MKTRMIFGFVVVSVAVICLYWIVNPTPSNRTPNSCASSCGITKNNSTETSPELTHVLSTASTFLQKHKPSAPNVPLEEQWFFRRWERRNSIAHTLSDYLVHSLAFFRSTALQTL